MIFIETNDAGAFFRFNDIYPKIIGGEMWVALDPQSADQAPQEGILNIRDFTVRGEAALDRVAASARSSPAGHRRASSSPACGSISPARSAASPFGTGW